MFTRQHHRAIAEIVKKNTILGECQTTLPKVSRTYRNTQRLMANDLADYFEQGNPRFDRQKFLEACGI